MKRYILTGIILFFVVSGIILLKPAEPQHNSGKNKPAAYEYYYNEKKQEEIAELAMNQHDIIEGYYRQKKYEVLFSHLNFVAFASYLFEYAGKHGFFTKVEFQNGFKVFEDIYRMLKEAEQKK